MKKYPIMNFKSPVTYIYILLMLAISAIPVLIMIKYDDFWLDEVASLAILILLVLLLYPLAGRVIVDDTSITKKTIFGTRSVKIRNIKSFGVMKQEGELGVRILEESEFDSIDWIFSKSIFISGEKDYNPLSYKQEGTIKVHYREDLYLDILQRIADYKGSRYDQKS